MAARESTAVAVQRDVKAVLENRRDEFAKALAGRVDPDSFVRVAYATITKTPRLGEATHASILMALLECATLGLTPNSVMGEAYLVPYNNKVKGADGRERWEVQAQFIPGFRGLAKLARNSGEISKVVARTVREGDVFKVVQGTEEKLVHEPLLTGEKTRKMTHVYAVAVFKDGTTMFDVMEKWEVDRIRQRSKSKDNGPWVTDYDEMAKKTVFRRLSKYLPLADRDFERALEADNRDYEVTDAIIAEAAASLSESRAAQIDARAAQVAGNGSHGPPVDEQPAVVVDDDPEPEKREEPPRQGRRQQRAAEKKKAEPTETVDTTTGEVTEEEPPAEETKMDPKLESVNAKYFALLAERGKNADATRRKFQKELLAQGLVSSASCKEWRKIDYMSAIAELEAQGAGPSAGSEEDEYEAAMAAKDADGDQSEDDLL